MCGLGFPSFSNSTFFLILENKDFKNYNYVYTTLDTRYLNSPITEIFQNENNSYVIAKVCIYVFRPNHTAAEATECSSSSRIKEITMDEPTTSSPVHLAPQAVTDTNCNSLSSGSFGVQCTSRGIPSYLDRYSLYQIPKFTYDRNSMFVPSFLNQDSHWPHSFLNEQKPFCNTEHPLTESANSQRFYKPEYTALIQTFRCRIVTQSGQSCRVRVMIDSGSSLTIVHRDIFKKLDLEAGYDGPLLTLGLRTSGGGKFLFQNQKILRFKLRSLCNTYQTPYFIESISCPYTAGHIDQIKINPNEFPHLASFNAWTDKLPMSAAYVRKHGRIDVLLGEPHSSYIVDQVVKSPYLHHPSLAVGKLGCWLLGAVSVNKEEESQEFNNGSENQTCTTTSTRNYFYIKSFQNNVLPKSINLDRFFSLEAIGIREDLYKDESTSYYEKLANTIMESTIQYFDGEKPYYAVRWPFVNSPPQCTNIRGSFASTRRLLVKAAKRPQKWEFLVNLWTEMLEKDYIEKVPQNELEPQSGKSCYISYSIVEKKDPKATTPQRLVFTSNMTLSCSCVPSCEKTEKRSLNDYLLTGENLLPLLPACIILLRKYKKLCILDVKKMFWCCRLQPEAQDYCRFFISRQKLEDLQRGEKLNLEQFRSKRVVFGMSSSPFILLKLLRIHSAKYYNSSNKVVAQMAKNLSSHAYMDDIFVGGNSARELSENVRHTQMILHSAGLETHKYNTNCRESLRFIENQENMIDESPQCRVLGNIWAKKADKLYLNFFSTPFWKDQTNDKEYDMSEDEILLTETELFGLKDSPAHPQLNLEIAQELFQMLMKARGKVAEDIPSFSKRGILSLVAKLFDTCGFLSPFLLQGKNLVQRCWYLNLPWDLKFGESGAKRELKELQLSCKNWALQLHKIVHFSIDRCLIPPDAGADARIIEINTFCDASGLGFGCVCYVTSADSTGRRFSRLAYAKPKVIPKKQAQALENERAPTICRLELTAAYLGVKCALFVEESLALGYSLKKVYFSDSQVTLARIARPHGAYGTYKLFTANRLKFIEENSDKKLWFFIDSKTNYCADILSRQGNLDDFIFEKQWTQGPHFLNDPNYQPVRIGKCPKQFTNLDCAEIKLSTNLVGLTLLYPQPPPPNAKNNNDQFLSISFWEEKELGLFFRYETFKKLTKVVAWMLHYIQKLRDSVKKTKQFQAQGKERQGLPLLPKVKCKDKKYLNQFFLARDEIYQSKIRLFRYCQERHFSLEISVLQNQKQLDLDSPLFKKCKQAELQSKRLNKLLPYYDNETNLIRVSVRTPRWKKNPIALPQSSPLTQLYMRSIHLLFNHSSIADTSFYASSEVIALGGRQGISEAIKGCSCRKPVDLTQITSPLPDFRYEDAIKNLGQNLSYSVISCDFMGPIYVASEDGRGNRAEVSFCLLITCAYSRHISSYLCKQANTENVIAAMRSHVAQRGNFRLCILDGARAFQRTSKLLRRLVSNVDFNEVRSRLSKFSPEFHFTKPTCSWENGLTETMIGLLRTALSRAIGTSALPFHHLSLVIQECVSIINSRPLSFVTSTASRQPQPEVVVTPNLLCNGRETIIFPEDFEINSQDQNINVLYSKRTRQLRLFWKIWYTSFCNSLAFNKSWSQKLDIELSIGQYVLLRDKPDFKKRINYHHAIITKLIYGRDNLIRSVQLRTPQHKTEIVRSVRQISLLESDYLKLVEKRDKQSIENHRTHWASMAIQLRSK